MDDLTRWEGQDATLQPPGPADHGASATVGSDSGSASWVDVRWATVHEILNFCNVFYLQRP